MNFKKLGTYLLIVGLAGFLFGAAYHNSGTKGAAFNEMFGAQENKKEIETILKYWERGGSGDRSAVSQAAENRAARIDDGKMLMLVFGTLAAVGFVVRLAANEPGPAYRP